MKLTPTHMFAHYDDITPAFLQSIGVRALLIDIDNTLAPYEQESPDERLHAWLGSLREARIRVALVSNNHAPRVEKFNESLGLPAYADSRKPFKKTCCVPCGSWALRRRKPLCWAISSSPTHTRGFASVCPR